jgi:hypothetical protein
MNETEWLNSGDAAAMYTFLIEETTLFKTRWQGSVPVRRFQLSKRKLYLFSCACCYRIMHLVPIEEIRQYVVVAERYAEGFADGSELKATTLAAHVARQREFQRRFDQMGSSWSQVEEEAMAAVGRLFDTERERRSGMIRAAALAAALEAVGQTWPQKTVEVAKLQVIAGSFPVDAPITEARCRAALEQERANESARQAALLRDIVGNPFQVVTIDPAWLRWNTGCVEQIARGIYDDRRFAELPVLADALEEAGCDNAEILGHCRQPGEHVRGCWVLDSLLGRA